MHASDEAMLWEGKQAERSYCVKIQGKGVTDTVRVCVAYLMLQWKYNKLIF